MKKLLTLAFAICALSVSAQYKHAVGPIVGTLYGGSYKTFFNDHLALQTDLGIGLHRNPGAGYVNGEYYRKFMNEGYWNLMVNPNLLYQAPIATPNSGTFSYYIGGGIHLGMAMEYSSPEPLGNAGANAMAGIEWSFNKIPLALSFDFRPGYSCVFGIEKYYSTSYIISLHMFDWAIGLSARYYFK
ncbi:MAG: hypothetical protein IJ814_00860 [Paludibacteraceae bacterium]|nr:hypothetical protein [Paludibacteraceae bacterium]